MAYMPFTADGAAAYFRRFERRYSAFGGTHFRCVPADLPEMAVCRRARADAARKLLSSHIIYLAGGNTFHFFYHQRRSGLLCVLRDFAAQGGVLAGLSAGTDILNPNIELAGYPEFDCDANDIGLPADRFRSLGVVGFEFFPHYRNSRRYRDSLKVGPGSVRNSSCSVQVEAFRTNA